MRTRITYANVMTTLALVLAVGGASAFAAGQLAKNSVGKKQLKANAVTTAKIKKAAVTRAKIRNGAIDTTKVADGSLGSAEVSAAGVPFGRRVQTLSTSASVPVAAGVVYPLSPGSWVQNAGEHNFLVGGVDITFSAACTAPREVVALLLVDPVDPAKPTITDLAGIFIVEDEGGGAVTRRYEFGDYVVGGMSLFAPETTTTHTASIVFVDEECGAGSGITASGASLDVIGVK